MKLFIGHCTIEVKYPDDLRSLYTPDFLDFLVYAVLLDVRVKLPEL